MKVFRITLPAVAFAAFAMVALAHSKFVTSSSATAAFAPANIAVIDSSKFAEDTGGIAKVTTVLKQHDAKYKPIRDEIQGMQQRVVTMKSDLAKKAQVQAASATAQQQEEIDRLELQIKRKAEDAQANYQKDYQSSMDPLQADIGKALDAYAQAKGITLLLDLNRIPVIYAADSLDVTKDFITEYNRTHPATGAAPARP
jgi:Skp family chaperone for outer membrane proteins